MPSSNVERRLEALERAGRSNTGRDGCVLLYPFTDADQHQVDRLHAAGRTVFLLPRNGRD